MPSQPARGAARVVARLPSGEILDPSLRQAELTRAICPGPNQWGSCPTALAGGTRPCAGAEWLYVREGEPEWRGAFYPGTAACPMAALDPFGPLAAPAD